MHLRSLLLAGTIVGACPWMALPAMAATKTTTTTTTAQTAEQIEALETQLRAMEAQVSYMKRQIEIMQTANPPHPDRPPPKVVQSSTNRFSIESADGQYSIGLTGRIHLDVGDYFDVSPKNKLGPIAGGAGNLSSGFNARRARIGVTGKVAGDWNYTVIWDGGNSQDTTAGGLQSAQIGFTGFKGPDWASNLEIGYSDTFFTLDEATSSNDIMFMERASPAIVATALNAGDFRSNVGARFYGDRWWVGAYFTGPKSSSDSHTLTAERIGAFQRATYQVLQEPDYTLHVGADIDELIKAPNSGSNTAYTVTLSDQPELRIDPTSFLSTGALGTTVHPVTGGYIFNAELAGNYQNFYAQGEYFHYNVDRMGWSSAEFDGGYGEVAWTFTGESRKYSKASGAYGTIVPAHNFSLKDGYWGAWEVAARVSYVDLTSNFIPGTTTALQPNPGFVNGGKQTNFTFGLNWYPNTYMRFMLNYVHVDFDKAATSAATGIPLGSPIGTQINAIALRSQVNW